MDNAKFSEKINREPSEVSIADLLVRLKETFPLLLTAKMKRIQSPAVLKVAEEAANTAKELVDALESQDRAQELDNPASEVAKALKRRIELMPEPQIQSKRPLPSGFVPRYTYILTADGPYLGKR